MNSSSFIAILYHSYLYAYVLSFAMPSQPRARDVQKTPKIQITNFIAKSQLVPPFSLSSLEVKHPFSPKALSRIFIPYKHVKFSIFHTGTVLSRAARSFDELDDSFNWLSSEFLPDFNLKLSDKYDVLNIVALSDFCVGSIDLSELATHLHSNCSYDPCATISDKDDLEHLVDCITYYFHEGRPHYTALIFSTGKVIFTGFKSIAELELHCLKLSSSISKICLNHPEVILK